MSNWKKKQNAICELCFPLVGKAGTRGTILPLSVIAVIGDLSRKTVDRSWLIDPHARRTLFHSLSLHTSSGLPGPEMSVLVPVLLKGLFIHDNVHVKRIGTRYDVVHS